MTLPSRFLGNFDASNPCTCWEYRGKRNANGYGVYNDRLAHRLTYEHHVGPIPAHLEIDHLCRNRACVNPAHLEAVTHAENVRRGRSMEVSRERMLAKTHCAQGHEWTPENTRHSGGQRKCRACDHAYKARVRMQRQAVSA